MMHRSALMTGFVLAALLLGASTAQAERSKDTIVRSLADRYPALYGLIAAGKVGETYKGIAEVVDPKFLTEVVVVGKAKKKMTVKQLLEDENKDRGDLYVIIAKEERTTPEAVAKQNGQRKKSTLKKGQYFKGKDGEWTRKR